MANARNGNTVYIDATGDADIRKNVRVAHIFFTPNLANDQLVLKDGSTSGAIKFSCKGATAEATVHFDLSSTPIFFPNGIYVATLDASGVALLVETAGGGE